MPTPRSAAIALDALPAPVPEPERLWRRVTALFVAGGLLVLIVFGVWSWQETYDRVDSALTIEVRMAADAVQAALRGLGNDLPYLGELLLQQTPPSLEGRYRILHTYDSRHPDVASMVLFTPDGRMLLNTARPLGARLPDPRRHPAILASIRAALRAPDLWVGRTQKGLVLGAWRIPVRYVVRGPRGTPRYILQASMLLSTLTRDWVQIQLSSGAAIGLIRNDGIHLARLPAPHPERLYSTTMTGPLIETMHAHPARTGGGYEGQVQSDRTRRIGRYARLRDFPMAVYISVPMRTVWAAWWRTSAPFLGLGLFGLVGYVGLARVLLSRERGHLRALAQESRRDPLTGLPNLLAAREWLDRTLVDAHGPVGLLQVHLDDFADVHDVLGAAGGDQVLHEVAIRLQTHHTDPQGLVAHLGVEQFLVGVPGADLLRVHRLARVLQDAINQPLEIGEHTLRLHASIGVTAFPDDADTADDLLRAVASAVHVAQHDGRGIIGLYDPDSSRQSVARVRFQHAIERALARDEFVIHYQPMIALDTRRVVGAEALIRWQDPERGLVPPAEFIPLAEATGWISAIGEWTVRRVCRDWTEWQATGLRLRISVNLSADEFRNPDFPLKLRRALAVAHMDPTSLEFEVTETALMQDVQRSAHTMHSLVDLGLRFAIDDFGTGHASLAYLRRLPVQVIKIDQEFVRGLDVDGVDRAIVQAVTALAQGLGCTTVAEGIETEAQYRILKDLGVHAGQGFWISHPLPREEFATLVRRYVHLPPSGLDGDAGGASERS
ncbi:MAG: hypothetical protein B7Z66_12950 [Chromatiales bacterium 21-64-14]|nr:MAG: hypothetical protein B7Z66_12950 [Chromatiales bacterium 21-64-14]HQU16369.1 EAL domain-containing protein [Gammaproteobacteria bacterium]